MENQERIKKCPLGFISGKNFDCVETDCAWFGLRGDCCAIASIAIDTFKHHGMGAYDEGHLDGYDEGFGDGSNSRSHLGSGNFEDLYRAVLTASQNNGKCLLCGTENLNDHAELCIMGDYGPIEKPTYPEELKPSFIKDERDEEYSNETPYLSLKVLEKICSTMKHARIFITSREKMHPTGINLYDDLYEFLRNVFSSATKNDEEGDTEAEHIDKTEGGDRPVYYQNANGDWECYECHKTATPILDEAGCETWNIIHKPGCPNRKCSICGADDHVADDCYTKRCDG